MNLATTGETGKLWFITFLPPPSLIPYPIHPLTRCHLYFPLSQKKKLTQEWGSSFDQEPGSAEESLLSSPSSFSAICSKSPPQSHATTSARSFPLPPHQPLLPTPSQRIPPASAPSSLRALHDVRTLTELRRRGALQPPSLPLPFSKKKLTTPFKEEATCVKDIRGANPHQLTCP